MVLTDYKYPMDVVKASSSRLPSINLQGAGFGTILSDHMFVADFRNGKWQRGKIEPYGPMAMGPAASALNYGQSIFEGMKAFRNKFGKVQLFRPLDHWRRFNKSAERMAMATVPEDVFMAGLLELIRLDEKWAPSQPGCSLYIRPVMFATDEAVGVRTSSDYRFAIVTSPVNPYYADPVKALASDKYIRAAEGGVGNAKCAGNYGLAMLAGAEAKKQGYHVVVWLDARERRYLEEFSTMNAFLVIDDVVYTPSLEKGTILDGITRRSVIQLMKDEGYEVRETNIDINEVAAAAQKGRLKEAFGTGTAAVVAPVQLINYKGKDINIPPYSEWKIAPRIAEKMQAIRDGIAPDTYGWMMPI